MESLRGHEFIFHSKLPDIYIPTHLPLHTYYFENLPQFKDCTCLINDDTDETFTYAEVELTACIIAASLNNIGIQQGDIIMLLFLNCHQFATAFLKSFYYNDVATTANPFYMLAKVAQQVTVSKAKLIITQVAYIEKVTEHARANDVKVMCINTPLEDNVITRRYQIHFDNIAARLTRCGRNKKASHY